MTRFSPRKEVAKKSGWTQESATNHICKVNRGRLPMGLSYLGACGFLHVDLEYAKTIKF